MDEIADLRLFTRIVAAGSLSEAARRFNSSVPALSRRLKALEDQLGVRLVERTSRRFVATDEGAALYERALRILADVDEAVAETRAGVRTPSGRLRIGAPTQFGRRRLAGLVADFSERFPRVACELVLSDAGLEVGRDVLDIVLRTTTPNETGVVTTPLLKGRRVVCASPAYLAARGEPLEPADLSEHECIRLVRGFQVMDQWGFSRSGRMFEIRVQGKLSSTSAEVVHGWVLEGRGVAVKASWDIEVDLAEGRLVECLADFSRRDMYLNAVVPQIEPMPSRLKLFLDFVRAELAEGLA